jgi:hypothetical protein
MEFVSFEILDVRPGENGKDHGYYRILTKSKVIKYLQFQATYAFPDIRGELLDFNTVPTGNWNVGYLARKANEEKLVLESVGSTTFKGIHGTWHTSFVDCLELGKPYYEEELQCLGRIKSSVYPGQLGAEKVFANWEWCSTDMYHVENETENYRLIQGHNIGPKFLAHVTENGERTIGFMTEHVAGRHATIEDLEACRHVLSKLHSLGIAHGPLEIFKAANFIVTSDRVLLHNFSGSYQTDDQSVFEKEMGSLEGVLRDGWHSPEPLSKELSDQIVAISERDGGLHPAVVHQAEKEGEITITEAEHKAMLVQLRQDGGLWKVED